MEEQFYADRVHLKQLLDKHPDWTKRQCAEATGRSVSWVKKWKKRILAAPDDLQVLRGLSRRPHHPSEPIHDSVVQRILAIRDNPPDDLRRTPGAKPILYFLHRDQVLQASGHHLPTSTRTIYTILHRHHRIPRPQRRDHQPVERPDPLSSWQIDFKDVSSVPADPLGKQQHVVETFNVVDVGSSIVLDAVVRDDFTADTAIWAAVHTLLQHGVPRHVTFDRDPRFVGGWGNQDFPAPFVRLWMTLGVAVTICPPQRPDQNGFVERYHRSYQEECLQIDRPRNLEEAASATERYVTHYNHQRPNQAITCGNRPPCQAVSQLPTLPKLPEQVDPDRWLEAIDGRCYTRRINAKGSIKVDNQSYYVKEKLRGQYVMVRVDAQQRQLVVEFREQVIKRLNIKGLESEPMDFEVYFPWLLQQAQTHWRRMMQQRKWKRAV